MSKKFINATHVEGYVYEHKLEKKVSGENSKNPGTEFIAGTLSVATDDELMNVVQVRFRYVTEMTAKGKQNATYSVLMNIIDGKIGNVMEHGKENAGKVRIDSAVGLNEFYSNRNGSDELVSVKCNEGGFVHMTQTLGEENSRATFNTDMLITGVTRIEEDPDRNQPERVTVKGCVFDFRGAILPVEFTALDPKAMDYFEGLDASQKNPVFTRVQGMQVSKTIVRTIEEESAFGDSAVKEVRNSQRDFVITWALPGGYEWDSEDTLLASELTEKIANREVYLADLKKRQEDFQATRENAINTTTASTNKEYKF